MLPHQVPEWLTQIAKVLPDGSILELKNWEDADRLKEDLEQFGMCYIWTPKNSQGKYEPGYRLDPLKVFRHIDGNFKYPALDASKGTYCLLPPDEVIIWRFQAPDIPIIVEEEAT